MVTISECFINQTTIWSIRGCREESGGKQKTGGKNKNPSSWNRQGGGVEFKPSIKLFTAATGQSKLVYHLYTSKIFLPNPVLFH